MKQSKTWTVGMLEKHNQEVRRDTERQSDWQNLCLFSVAYGVQVTPRKESDHRPGPQLLNEPLALKLGSQQAQETQATNLTPHCPLGTLQKRLWNDRHGWRRSVRSSTKMKQLIFNQEDCSHYVICTFDLSHFKTVASTPRLIMNNETDMINLKVHKTDCQRNILW